MSAFDRGMMPSFVRIASPFASTALGMAHRVSLARGCLAVAEDGDLSSFDEGLHELADLEPHVLVRLVGLEHAVEVVVFRPVLHLHRRAV